jgi:hypothetical protein
MESTDMNWRKASYSNGGENCVEVGSAPWRKSSHSGSDGGSCVETASADGAVFVRDTTQAGDPSRLTLTVAGAAWTAFTASVR